MYYIIESFEIVLQISEDLKMKIKLFDEFDRGNILFVTNDNEVYSSGPYLRSTKTTLVMIALEGLLLGVGPHPVYDDVSRLCGCIVTSGPIALHCTIGEERVHKNNFRSIFKGAIRFRKLFVTQTDVLLLPPLLWLRHRLSDDSPLLLRSVPSLQVSVQ